MLKCHRLWKYAAFIELADWTLDSGYPLEQAVSDAIDNCIRKDILKDILVQCRSEVLDMFLTEYDEKLHLEASRVKTAFWIYPSACFRITAWMICAELLQTGSTAKNYLKNSNCRSHNLQLNNPAASCGVSKNQTRFA